MEKDGAGSQGVLMLEPELVPLTARELDQQFPGILDGVSLMGGGANVILQLARPGVGYGVMESRVESGQIFRRPLKRTRTTLTYLAVAMLGTVSEKQAYRRAIDGVHAQVYATPQSPADPAAFYTYWQQQLSRIQIDAPVRAYLTDIAELKFLPSVFSRGLGPFNRFVTAGFLPAPVREAMHFSWSPSQQKKFDRLMAVIAVVSRNLPRLIRQLPFIVVMWDFRRRLRKGVPLV